MKKLSVLFITLFLSVMLYAKGNYENGYIITHQQDTIFGWINLRTNKNNQKRCEFKTDLKLAAKIYFPEDIAGYRFINSGKYYVSREIRLNEKSQKVFLEFLVKGIMNLYYYEEDNNNNNDNVSYYFFENQDRKMEVISQKPERVENMIIYKDYEYRKQILSLFKDYQPVAQKAYGLNFDQKSMMDVVEEYHNEICTTGESCIIFKNEYPDDMGFRCKFSVYTGLQLSTYIFDNDLYADQTVSNVSPVLGGQVNFLNSRWSKSFSLQVDVSFSLFKGHLSKLNRHPYYKAVSYEALVSSIRLGVKYTYPKGRISPTVEAGCALTFLEEKGNVNLRHSYYGYYFAAGADYGIKTGQVIFVRLVYENYPFLNATQFYMDDKISLPHIKTGYTF